MSGLFQGLEIGKRALLTHQLSMTTVGHNIANVSTPGYTRQRVTVVSTDPLETANYNIGTGVTATTITQIRDPFLTTQYRRENKSLGEWESREKSLGQIETFFSEPTDNGLGDVLDNFWNSWQDLANAVGSGTEAAARSAVVSQSQTLVETFHYLSNQLDQLQSSCDSDVVARVGEINETAKEIAELNRMIASEELGGQTANDLRDQRDLLIDDLSKMVDVTTSEKANGSVTVSISGMTIVEDKNSFALGTKVSSSEGESWHDVVWGGTSSTIKITGGELKGLIDTRDEIIPEIREQLDELAASLVSEVNSYHRAGYAIYEDQGVTITSTGLDFFNSNYTTADTIQLETAIENNSNLIAVSADGAEGDNSNALNIASVQNKTISALDGTTLNGYYNAIVGQVGVKSNEAQTFRANSETLMQQIETSRESVQGVSLDEEMTDMIKLQHAYDAAARVITYMDEALDTLIQGMGVVGR